jgi:hypothetical protein
MCTSSKRLEQYSGASEIATGTHDGASHAILVERTATMTFARGDRKPCSYSGCDGTMQFSNYVQRTGLHARAVGDSRSDFPPTGETPGWVCDTDATHFEGTAVYATWHV